jgi:hypothetical protein
MVAALALVLTMSASANWGGTDPTKNYPLPGKLPLACATAPAGTECINAGIYYLDQARKSVGLGAYELPNDFPTLTPPEQMFILTNLDRVEYGLPPISGLTAALSRDALAGVKAGKDPHVSDQSEEHEDVDNYGVGYDNVPMVYEVWLWADGAGSQNDVCRVYHRDCWVHRHNVLWKFTPTDILAMGAAAAIGKDAEPGYAQINFGGWPADASDPGYTPTYTYTWDEAVADGATTNAYDPGTPNTNYCLVPDVLDKPLHKAGLLLRKAGCAVGTVTHAHSSWDPRGFVIRQRPGQGKTFATGKKIALVVSLGP